MALANNTVAEIGVARAGASGICAWDFAGTATVPTTATAALATGYVNLGYVGPDGIGGGRDIGTDEQRDSNGDIVFRLQTDFTRTYDFELLQSANVDVKRLIFGAANVTVTPATASTGTLITVNDTGEIGNHGRLVVTTFSGKATHREIVRDAQVTGVEFGPLVGTAVRSYTVTVTAYKVNGVYVTELDDDGVFTA
jgi:hypothetical protein